MKRLSWSDYFLAQAMLIANRSTCDRARVGCVIVKNNRILSTGYNGSVSGHVHCSEVGHYMVDGHCVRTVHAEINAITQCAKTNVSTQDAEVYVTHFPCLNCTKAIIQSGISRVYYKNDYRKDAYAEQLLNEAGITLQHIALDESSLEAIVDLLHE